MCDIVWPSNGPNSPICTRFPEIKCVFLSLRVRCVLHYFLVHRFSIAAVHCMCAWHLPVYAKAHCCFKSFALDLINVAVKLDMDSSFGR